MANPYDYITIAEDDILHDPRSPHNFLPTSLKQQGGQLLWTAPGYATYGTTPTNNDIMYSSYATYCYKLEEKVVLPPNLQKIHQGENATYSKNSILPRTRTPQPRSITTLRPTPLMIETSKTQYPTGKQYVTTSWKTRTSQMDGTYQPSSPSTQMHVLQLTKKMLEERNNSNPVSPTNGIRNSNTPP